MLKRKLVHFTTDKNGMYELHFAYYHEYEDGDEYTGVREVVEFSEEQLYTLLKPLLRIEVDE